MDQRTIHQILGGGRRCPGAFCLRGLLWLASKPYGGLMRLRRWAYRRGVLRSHRADVPVICVGNLTTGGTGKTPMVAWIVERLQQAGHKPAVLTRGYKSHAGAADEAVMIVDQTGAAVVIDPDRVAGAAQAVADGADVLVMDDGFQHHRLRRDLDIVLVDATNPFGYGHVLPRGLLREPISALADAQAVVITRSDQADPEAVKALQQRLAELAPQASLHSAFHEPVGLVDQDGEPLPLEALAGKKAFCFAGLANPRPFFEQLEQLGADPHGLLVLEDHVEYTPAMLAEMRDEAGDCRGRAEVMVTTAKDRVKIDDPSILGMPLWTLEVRTRFVLGREELLAKIMGLLGA